MSSELGSPIGLIPIGFLPVSLTNDLHYHRPFASTHVAPQMKDLLPWPRVRSEICLWCVTSLTLAEYWNVMPSLIIRFNVEQASRARTKGYGFISGSR